MLKEIAELAYLYRSGSYTRFTIYECTDCMRLILVGFVVFRKKNVL